MDDRQEWARRQRTALTGLVPIAALALGVPTGSWLAGSMGAPDALGAVVGGIAAFFVSRGILRWVFGRQAV